MTKPGRPDAAEMLAAAESAYAEKHAAVLADPYYPALHLAAPVGRLNDPNGLVYKDGVYHAFYQYAPTHPARDIFWRHAQSTDLIHWEDGPNALAPVHWYDCNGCYSGSAYTVEDGSIEFFYTGNVKNPDGSRETYQNLAISRDDCQTFEIFEGNPLISGTPEGYTPHFRDPSVYLRDGRYYALIGTQHEDLTGAIVLYSSADRRTWEFEGELEFSDPAIATYGYMLECPQVISLTDRVTGQRKDVLLFCPQGMDADGEKYNNKYQSGYVVGTLKGTYFEVETPFTEFDAGFEFYAPQVFNGSVSGDEALIVAWFGISDQDDMPSWESGWLHLFTLPRWISLENGLIVQRPAEGLDRALPPAPADLEQDGTLAAVQDARVFRISGTLDVSTGPVTLAFEDEQGTALTLSIGSDHAVMDRSGTRYTVWGPVRQHTFTSPSDRRTFDLLVDASAIEVFIDGGRLTMSGRSYFTGSDRTVRCTDAAGAPATHLVSQLSCAVLAED